LGGGQLRGVPAGEAPKGMNTAIELGKAFGSVVAVILAAAVAWAIRRAERLKDAWADWGAPVYNYSRHIGDLEPPATMSVGQYTPNPLWSEWHKMRHDAIARLMAAHVALLVKERDRMLRWCSVRVMEALGDDLKSEAEKATTALLRYLSRTDSVILSLRPPVKLPPDVQEFMGRPPDSFEPDE
jgi:hypothetical protein